MFVLKNNASYLRAMILFGLLSSPINAAFAGALFVSPSQQVGESSVIRQIASKMTEKQQAEAKDIQVKVEAAVNLLKDSKEFITAIEKKDSRGLSRMIQKASVIDVPVKVRLNGDGPVGELRIDFRDYCCPFGVIITISW